MANTEQALKTNLEWSADIQKRLIARAQDEEYEICQLMAEAACCLASISKYLTAAPQASQPIGQPTRPMSKNWDEDTAHENGNYQNTCAQCNGLFIGHKRRVICKQCDFHIQPVSGAMTDDEIYNIALRNGYVDCFSDFQDDELLRKEIISFGRKLLSASGQAVSEKAVRDAALTDDRIAELYRESFNAMIGRLREAPKHVPHTVIEFARSIEREVRALSSPPAQTEAPVNVPSGWKLVPHEPTAEMRNEGADMMWDRKGTSVDVWQAMWNAAPAPVQTEAQQSEKDAERAIKDQIRAAYDDGYNHGKANGNSGCSRYVGGKVEAERGNRVIAAIAKEKAKS